MPRPDIFALYKINIKQFKTKTDNISELSEQVPLRVNKATLIIANRKPRENEADVAPSPYKTNYNVAREQQITLPHVLSSVVRCGHGYVKIIFKRVKI